MKRGEHVRVKMLPTNADNQFRGREGIVIQDNARGEVVIVEFEDEAIAHQFIEEDLERI
jgi:hypothetical protein